MSPVKAAQSKPHETEEDKIEKGMNILDRLIDVELENECNEKKDVMKIISEENVVFFMYPKANTPGCTKQACGFKEHFDDFNAHGFQVYGLSKDKPSAQNSWKKKYSLSYSLLSDPESRLIKLFGCYKSPGTIRSHVVIAKGGEVLDIQRFISPVDSYTKALEIAKSSAQTQKNETKKTRKEETEKKIEEDSQKLQKKKQTEKETKTEKARKSDTLSEANKKQQSKNSEIKKTVKKDEEKTEEEKNESQKRGKSADIKKRKVEQPIAERKSQRTQKPKT